MIIFAGKELHDSELLEEYNLAEQTVLHAVKSRRRSLKRDRHVSVSVEEDEEEFDDKKRTAVNFYVYCSLPCANVTVGKIRVRCFECKSGAFTVDGDPKNWNDVLKPKRITGHCETYQCTVRIIDCTVRLGNCIIVTMNFLRTEKSGGQSFISNVRNI